ncbi:MAG: Crp/Fnr family transcriptional regulator [Oscillibacter sp.]|nr:Crp/Fnr family transcriptional regulator [Oscillibacter sp.]
MLNEQELEKSALFHGIGYQDYCEILSCFQAVQRSFRADDLIYDFTSDAVGVVERGQASLIRIDEDGVATVLEDLGAGGVFGKTLAFAGTTGDSLEVVCRRPCDVVFLDYSHIFTSCSHACTRHSTLVRNMLKLVADKAQALSCRVDVLSRRSIREKLLCYFRQLAQQAGGATFTLPFSLSTLADYTATDRSAMMRELKRLREEGSVRSDGRQFTLRQ